MTSEPAEAFVWVHLPGQAVPVVCGRFTHRRMAGGAAVGEFVYGRSYLARADAMAIDPVALPLQPQAFATPHLSGWFSVLLDAGPDAWGQRLIEQLHGPQDTLGYILRARGQPVGALSFSTAADQHPETLDAPGIGTLERLLDLHRAVETGEAVAEEDRALLLQGTSAGGARPKPEVQQYAYMGSYSNLAHRMREWERSPKEHIRELYRRIAFNCLVGNTDDHDLNTGFLAGGDGFFELAPAFDLTCRPRTPRMFLAMGFGRDGAALTLENLLSEPEAFGYETSEAGDLIRAMWDTIRADFTEWLLCQGCLEPLAPAVLAAMPGCTFFRG